MFGIGDLKTTSIEELKTQKKELDTKISSARELSDKTYANEIDELNKSIKQLKQTKETYELKKAYVNDDAEIGIAKIKEYKVEYLWTIVENYAKDEGVLLKLDLIENSENNLYNLDITVKGKYQGIMNFLEDIEKDDTLDFKIEDFKLIPTTVSVQTDTSSQDPNSTQKNVLDPSALQATFTIKNVKIILN